MSKEDRETARRKFAQDLMRHEAKDEASTIARLRREAEEAATAQREVAVAGAGRGAGAAPEELHIESRRRGARIVGTREKREATAGVFDVEAGAQRESGSELDYIAAGASSVLDVEPPIPSEVGPVVGAEGVGGSGNYRTENSLDTVFITEDYTTAQPRQITPEMRRHSVAGGEVERDAKLQRRVSDPGVGRVGVVAEAGVPPSVDNRIREVDDPYGAPNPDGAPNPEVAVGGGRGIVARLCTALSRALGLGGR